jgi:hypothetical protein
MLSLQRFVEHWEATQSYRAVFLFICFVFFLWTVEWGMAYVQHEHNSVSTTLWSESAFYLLINFLSCKIYELVSFRALNLCSMFLITEIQLSHLVMWIPSSDWLVYVGECAVYITGLADTNRTGLRRIITVSAIFHWIYWCFIFHYFYFFC